MKIPAGVIDGVQMAVCLRQLAWYWISVPILSPTCWRVSSTLPAAIFALGMASSLDLPLMIRRCTYPDMVIIDVSSQLGIFNLPLLYWDIEVIEAL